MNLINAKSRPGLGLRKSQEKFRKTIEILDVVYWGRLLLPGEEMIKIGINSCSSIIDRFEILNNQ